MLFILIALGVIVAAVLLALVLLPSLIDEAAIIELAREQVRQNTGGELRVEGGVALSLLPSVTLALGDATLDLPPQSDDASRILLNIDAVDIDLSLLDLLFGEAEFGQVQLSGADVTLFDQAGAATTVRLRELAAEGLSLSNQPISLRGELQIDNPNGVEPLLISLNGRVRVPADIDRVGIDSLNTRVTGALTEPLETQLSGQINLAPLSADLDLEAILPGGTVAGDLRYAAADSPQIDLSFSTERLDLDRIQVAAPADSEPAADTEQAPETAPRTQTVPAVPLPVGPLKDLDLKLTIDAKELLASGQSITNAQVLLRVVDGVTTLHHLRGVLHQGQLETRAVIDVRKSVVEATVSGGLKGVELDSLLTSVGSADTARGRVDMAWDLETNGVTAADLSQALDGELTVEGSAVELTAVSLQNLMCNAIAQVNQETLSQAMPATTEVTALSLSVDFADGSARLNNTQIATPGIALGGVGEAALASLDFKGRFVANIDPALENLDPACRVNDRLSDVDWPVTCLGNLQDADPNGWCRVDVDSIVKQLLENEAKSQLQKQIDKLGKDAGGVLNKLWRKK